MAGAREPTWSSQSGDCGPGPQGLSRSPEARLTTPTPAAVKVRVFGFIDWSQAWSVVATQALDSTIRRGGMPTLITEGAGVERSKLHATCVNQTEYTRLT
jgi:hypothetical protein